MTRFLLGREAAQELCGHFERLVCMISQSCGMCLRRRCEVKGVDDSTGRWCGVVLEIEVFFCASQEVDGKMCMYERERDGGRER